MVEKARAGDLPTTIDSGFALAVIIPQRRLISVGYHFGVIYSGAFALASPSC